MALSPAASERRLALRREMEIPVWVEGLPRRPGQPALLRALTRDISHRGAFLWMQTAFPPGQRLHLEMDAGPENGQDMVLRIECDAEVVRVQPPTSDGGKSGLGVRILRHNTPIPIYS